MRLVPPPDVQARLAGLAAPPEPGRWRSVAAAFCRAVESRYGVDVVGCYLFGSRARGDARADSDVDIAVVFRSGGEPDWRRLWDLSGIAYDLLVDTGVHIQPHPTTEQSWAAGDGFLAAARRDAMELS